RQPEPVEVSATAVPDTTSRLSFEAGQLVLTQSVHHLVEHGHLDPSTYLRRHLSGDWGELPQEDWSSNQRALTTGERLFSSYDINAGDETQ
ncbi:class I SAM-dependent methyltransferase, partial [Pseudomonas sp. SIMBA_077]